MRYIIKSEQMNELYRCLVNFDSKRFHEIMDEIKELPLDAETPFGVIQRGF
jgi:hypothetical protein